uniref:E1 ubiquitin-activating enzyme n=1 Tax=Amphiprion percula TaxID=161767 RepID=A0A3P8SVT2_AMPPE
MSGNGNIDEGFYSRQYVLGHEAMYRMGTASVLIAGMRGLGVEIAKNVILSGVKSVTVQDEGPTAWADLSSQFFLKESHLGQNRAACSLQQLSALNPHVQVSAHPGPLNEDLILKFQVVVLTDSSLDDQRRFGDLCHSRGIKFIVADTKGLCQLFCDFGKEFEVLDQDGEMPVSVMIQHVSKDNPGVVVCTDDQKHGLTDGSKVVFSEVQGMTELNNIGPVEIKFLSYSFSICDTSAFNEYKRGGVATEVKQSCLIHFKPLTEALQDQDLLKMNDFGKIARHKTLHLAFQALHSFVKKEQQLPRSWSQSDADSLLAIVRELNKVTQLENLDEAAVQTLSYTAQGDLAPMNAFIGGLAAQEVIKLQACSGKFTPLQQWLYFDALECLPEEEDRPAESSFSAKASRYDGQIAVFGSAFQEKLERQKYFLVGAGAIGCELLKNFALIGLGAGENGHITVTDMDFIERSNLNRQFLFRSQDIGQKPKSEVAAKAVCEMNPQMKITAHQNRLDPDSEGVYDYNFFMGLDGVAAALDTVEAVYLDRRCVQHLKPLLEGGTLGTKGHTLAVVPHLTESYEDGKSSFSDAIPLCTLRNFPHRIEHTLQFQWARDQFEGLFKQTPENVNLFLDSAFVERTLSHGDAEALEILGGVWNSLEGMAAGGQRPSSWEDCVNWARLKWETVYNNDIHQLLHCFPPDEFQVTHMEYVVAAANLYGHIYGISGTRDLTAIRNILEQVHVPPFTPKSTVKIHVTDKEMEEDKKRGSDDADDDSNFHMDYIVAASNLRAENYDIPAADRHQSKRIAGKIIPAIATTTAAVAGLMCLELLKLVQGHQKITSYRTAYFNLAVQYFVLSLPSRPQDFEVAGKKYTSWDDFLVEGRRGSQQEMTLEDLFQYIKEKYSLNVCTLFYGTAILYVSEVVKMVTKKDIPPHRKMLVLVPSFAEDEDCEYVPAIRYLLL